MLDDFISEYQRYRLLGERAIAQTPDDALNHIPAREGNSTAMIVRHVSGNLASRFTNVLSEDGEKPWRARDDEFAVVTLSRSELDAVWQAGWNALTDALASLTDGDLSRTVTIRGQPLTVHAALCRSLAHVSNHIGQIILLARMSAEQWTSLSIPRGGTAAYNANPIAEKAPR